MQKLPLDSASLKKWFSENKRDLPWRRDPSPYAVWVSEVMLQQTQVSVVKGYYQRWMERFPTLSSLAEASLEEVIKAWEGLGYYSRVRNLHRGAREVMENCGGSLPQTYEELKKIPGLGPYTIGAILSFAYHQRAAAVDGNVLRVLARLTALQEEIDRTGVQKKLRQYAEVLLPHQEPWVVMEALIELGALVCTKEPKCAFCPLQGQCAGLKQGIADLLPLKRKRIAYTHLKRQVAVIAHGDQFLLRRGKKGQVMADLYEFPYFEGEEDLKERLGKILGFTVSLLRQWPCVKHSFTRYQVELFPSLWQAERKEEIPHCEWVDKQDLCKLPFSSGHRRVLKFLEEYAYLTH